VPAGCVQRVGEPIEALVREGRDQSALVPEVVGWRCVRDASTTGGRSQRDGFQTLLADEPGHRVEEGRGKVAVVIRAPRIPSVVLGRSLHGCLVVSVSGLAIAAGTQTLRHLANEQIHLDNVRTWLHPADLTVPDALRSRS
jgi:hypothetical protein